MKTIDVGITGAAPVAEAPGWADLGLDDRWRSIVECFAPHSIPHDLQTTAIRDCGLLRSRRNLIVSGPTNAGKTLLGYLAVFRGLAEGRRALLLEPFRALAQEKYDELAEMLPLLTSALGGAPGVEITTGDYRLSGETLMDAPPAHGQIVIATPERIEAIMRNQEFEAWVASFGVVCVDEAHLLGDPHRGATLEGVLTRLLCQRSPPRFILLSATLGGYEPVKQWLEPCDVAHSEIRRPALSAQILKLEEQDKTDDVVLSWIEEALRQEDTSVMVFVYRTQDAARLAKVICEKLGPSVAAAYHSKMSAAMKSETRKAYEAGRIRCLVSTTALGAGVNLPATHVLVRDLTFAGEGPLPLASLLQMMGRAGRGNRTGLAAAVLKPGDDWDEPSLLAQIRSPKLPELKSVLLAPPPCSGRNRPAGRQECAQQAAVLVLSQLVRRDGSSTQDLKDFFDRSLGGRPVSEMVESALRWLSDAQRVMAWKDPDKGWIATSLGRATMRSGIPLEVGSGLGQLIRDVLTCDLEDGLLTRWTPLDSLLVMELVKPRERGIRRFSQNLTEQVDDWIERTSRKSLLYAEWIRGASGTSRAIELLGSLGVSVDGGEDASRRYAYQAMQRSIIMTELAEGRRVEDVARRWSTAQLDGVEERWRDSLLWLLAGFVEILDLKCFYHHLKEECQADQARVIRVKKILGSMRSGVFELLGGLRFCSPLGPFFRDLEAAKAGVGLRTKEKLEALGLSTVLEIAKLKDTDLAAAGIRKDIVRKLRAYVTRRLL